MGIGNPRVSTLPGKTWIFYLKIPVPGKSWKNIIENHSFFTG